MSVTNSILCVSPTAQRGVSSLSRCRNVITNCSFISFGSIFVSPVTQFFRVVSVTFALRYLLHSSADWLNYLLIYLVSIRSGVLFQNASPNRNSQCWMLSTTAQGDTPINSAASQGHRHHVLPRLHKPNPINCLMTSGAGLILNAF